MSAPSTALPRQTDTKKLARKARRWSGKALLLALLLIGTAVFLIPIAWMVSTSLKSNQAVFELPIEWIPDTPLWHNYSDAYGSSNFTRYFINSAIITVCVTLLNVFLSTLAGYGLAKYRFRGRQLLLILVLATLMLPLEVIMIPLYLTVQTLGWQDTYQGVIFPLVANAIGVLVMRQYFLSLPDDLIAAARMDGAGHVRTFFQIALPLSWPATLTVAVLMFQLAWDDFVWAFLVLSGSDNATVPLAVRAFESAEGSNFPAMMAISTIASLPLAILFFLFQRQFIRGIATTGLR